MPTYTKIAPSVESQMPLTRPITVVSRAIDRHSIVDNHQHSWGQFLYAQKGVLQVSTNNERYIVPPEQGVWIMPYVDHEVTAVTELAITSFYFANELLPKLPKTSSVLQVSHFLKTLIIEANKILPHYCWEETDGRLLRLIADPSNKHNVVEWGKIIGMSARSLSRLFKKETGLSYRQWRQRLNIQIAMSQLSAGKSATSIALTLGYESPSAFIHMFKKNTATTPSLYRN